MLFFWQCAENSNSSSHTTLINRVIGFEGFEGNMCIGFNYFSK